MQAILKQALALTAKSEAAQWTQLQTAIKPKELNSTEIAQLAKHFAESSQGTESFWDQLQKCAVEQLDSFNKEDLGTLFRSMMIHPYDVDPEVGTAISEGIDYFFQEELEKQERADPYFVKNFVNTMQGGLSEPFPMGPGFAISKMNDDASESSGEEEDPELNYQMNNEVKTGLIEMKSTPVRHIESQAQLLAEVNEILGKNQNVSDIKEMK